MKYPCKLIEDLLPLYKDKACSDESSSIVKEHLNECLSCKNIYEKMCETDDMLLASCINEQEKNKANSLVLIKNKIRRKQILIALVSTILIFAITFTAVEMLKKSYKIIDCNKISVSMVEQNLISKIKGSVWSNSDSMRISIISNGQEKTYIFYCLTDSRWDDFSTNTNSYTEYMICPANKGAAEIDFVYYYTGDYTKLYEAATNNIDEVLKSSSLLWSKAIK